MRGRSGSSCRGRLPRGRPRWPRAGRSSAPRRAARSPRASHRNCSRSSSSLVRTQVIGQRSELTSSEWTTVGYGSGRHGAPLVPDPPRLPGLRPGTLADLAGGAAALRRREGPLPGPARRRPPAAERLAGCAGGRAGRDRRAADRALPLARVPAVDAPRRRRRRARLARAAGRAAVGGGRAGGAALVLPGAGVSMPDARLVCSDNDPYCPEGAASLYRRALCCPGRATSTRTPATGRGPRSRPGRAGESAVISSRIAPG